MSGLKKYLITERDCARKIINTARQRVDDVFTRLADMLHECEENTIRAVMAGSYYYHKIVKGMISVTTRKNKKVIHV